MISAWFSDLHGKIFTNLFLHLLCGMSAMEWEDSGCLDILCMTDVCVYIATEVPPVCYDHIVNVLSRFC